MRLERQYRLAEERKKLELEEVEARVQGRCLTQVLRGGAQRHLCVSMGGLVTIMVFVCRPIRPRRTGVW